MKDDAGGTSGPAIGTARFGVGAKARIAALRTADDLRSDGVVAVALFRPWLGEWVVEVYPGRIKAQSQPLEPTVR